MDDLRIREANVSDAEGIAKVHVYTWQNAYLGLIPDSFLQGLSVEQGTANREKELANQGEIYAIYVKPEFQECGIGAALMREGKAPQDRDCRRK